MDRARALGVWICGIAAGTHCSGFGAAPDVDPAADAGADGVTPGAPPPGAPPPGVDGGPGGPTVGVCLHGLAQDDFEAGILTPPWAQNNDTTAGSITIGPGHASGQGLHVSMPQNTLGGLRSLRQSFPIADATAVCVRLALRVYIIASSFGQGPLADFAELAMFDFLDPTGKRTAFASVGVDFAGNHIMYSTTTDVGAPVVDQFTTPLLSDWATFEVLIDLANARLAITHVEKNAVVVENTKTLFGGMKSFASVDMSLGVRQHGYTSSVTADLDDFRAAKRP